jgi:acetyltransferase EpsM
VAYLLIWGAGGHGKVVSDVAAAKYSDIALVDSSPSAPAEVLGNQVFTSLDAVVNAKGHPKGFLIAIGNNAARAACFARAIEAGIAPEILVHDSAVVSRHASLAPGTVVMPGAVINASATVGGNCIINTSAVVEHDCRIGDHVHMSPGAIAAGGTVVGDYAHVALGAILLPRSQVGRGAIVGAGAVVLRSVAEHETVAGVPARVIGSNNK